MTTDSKGQEPRRQGPHDREAAHTPLAVGNTYERSYLRAANEDDDGYDPYSDRPARPEPLFERDPWS